VHELVKNYRSSLDKRGVRKHVCRADEPNPTAATKPFAPGSPMRPTHTSDPLSLQLIQSAETWNEAKATNTSGQTLSRANDGKYEQVVLADVSPAPRIYSCQG
jgi:hypothetical protein